MNVVGDSQAANIFVKESVIAGQVLFLYRGGGINWSGDFVKSSKWRSSHHIKKNPNFHSISVEVHATLSQYSVTLGATELLKAYYTGDYNFGGPSSIYKCRSNLSTITTVH